jgi:hypothetical protein
MHQPANSATAKTPAKIDRRMAPPSSIRAWRLTRNRVLSPESASPASVARYTFYNVVIGRCGFVTSMPR